MSLLPTQQPLRATDLLNNICYASNPLLQAFPQMALATSNSDLNAVALGRFPQAGGSGSRFPWLVKLLSFPQKDQPSHVLISRMQKDAEAARKKQPAPVEDATPGGTGLQAPCGENSGYNAARAFAQEGISPEALKSENQAIKTFTKLAAARSAHPFGDDIKNPATPTPNNTKPASAHD